MALEDLVSVRLGEDRSLELEEDSFGNKDLVLITGVEYVTQSIQVRLLTIQGEYPFDAEFGFPYNQVVGIFNQAFVEGSIRRATVPDPDVKEITQIEIELGDDGKRSITARMAVTAEDGTQLGIEVAI